MGVGRRERSQNQIHERVVLLTETRGRDSHKSAIDRGLDSRSRSRCLPETRALRDLLRADDRIFQRSEPQRLASALGLSAESSTGDSETMGRKASFSRFVPIGAAIVMLLAVYGAFDLVRLLVSQLL